MNMQAQIVKDSVVTLKYTVSDADGNLIDDGSTPLVYLHGGYEGIFQLIEEALEGRKVGEQLTVRLQPEDAFGEYDEELVLLEDISQFPDNIEVGMAFERMADEDDEDDEDGEEGLPAEDWLHIWHGQAQPGDCYLLATDGLHGCLSDGQLQALWQAAASPPDALQALHAAYRRTGAQDDVSLALLVLP